MAFFRIKNSWMVSLFLFSFPLVTPGMDFYWEEFSSGDRLVLSGEIKAGDSEKLRLFLRKNFEKYKVSREIRLASNGGNMVEALKISTILRSVYAKIMVTGEKCASSCFFLYLSGIERYSLQPAMVGIHRAYFAASYFAGLKTADAKLQQVALKKLVDAILDENQVPQYLKERMNNTSSDDIYWLTTADINSIGLMPAWYEELMIAKCGYAKYKGLMNKYLAAPANDPNVYSYLDAALTSYDHYSDCEKKMIAIDLSKVPVTLIPDDPSKKPEIQ